MNRYGEAIKAYQLILDRQAAGMVVAQARDALKRLESRPWNL